MYKTYTIGIRYIFLKSVLFSIYLENWIWKVHVIEINFIGTFLRNVFDKM